MAKNKPHRHADKYQAIREGAPKPQSGVPSADRIRVTDESDERRRSMTAMFERWAAEELEAKKKT